MVDTLNLPLDPERDTKEVYKENEANQDMLVVEQNEELDKSLLDAKPTVTVSSANEQRYNPNKLIQAKEVLQSIICIH